MLRSLALLAAVSAAALAAAGSASAAKQCATRTVGPGKLTQGGTTGATCLLEAYRTGCRRAEYILSSVGLTTFVVKNFSVERRGDGCAVLVFVNIAVVKQPSRVLSSQCSRLRRVGADVVADRCTGGTDAISLTRFR